MTASDSGTEPNTLLRYARAHDLPALRMVYVDVVQRLATGLYSPEQVRAWARFATTEAFAGFIHDVDTLVADVDGTIHGFCGIGADGHVASVYVAGHAARRGLGARLLRRALSDHPDPTSGRYFAEASLLSRRLFLKLGFRQVGTEHVVRDGITFERFLVERPCGRTLTSARP
jgi:putative acetyltransferase